MTMTINEMREYIREELKEEHDKMLRGEENHYSYLYMIANDMGLIGNVAEKKQAEVKAHEQRLTRKRELGARMDDAIARCDKAAFREAFDVAGNYMTREELKFYFVQFTRKMAEDRR